MRSKFSKYFITILFLLLVSASSAVAGPLKQDNAFNVTAPAAKVGETAGYDVAGDLNNLTLTSYISTIIQIFLGLLGIIFLVLIIYAGFNWMTAQGDEEKVTKAKDTLRTAVIGLVIIVCAYSITYFVFNNLPGRSSGSSSGTGVGDM